MDMQKSSTLSLNHAYSSQKMIFFFSEKYDAKFDYGNQICRTRVTIQVGLQSTCIFSNHHLPTLLILHRKLSLASEKKGAEI